MDARDAQESQSARVLAIGGLAAGVAGSLYVLLSEREKKPKSRLDAARQTLEDAAERTRKQAAHVESSMASSLLDARGKASSKGKKTSKDARKASRRAIRQARRKAEHRQDGVIHMFSGARNKGVEKLQELEKQAPDVTALANKMLGRTEGTLGRARKAGRITAKQARKDASKAQSELVSMADRVKEKAPETMHYVEERVVPSVKGLQKHATGVLEQGRGRAEELRKQAEKDVVPQVKDAATRLKVRAEHDVVPQVLGTAERLKGRVEDQAKVAATVLEKGSAEAAHKLAEASGSVEVHAKDAGTAVARGGREFRSLLVWLSLGGTLIYTVFLNDEQREKVKDLANRWFGEAKEMYGDIKGQDGSFDNA